MKWLGKLLCRFFGHKWFQYRWAHSADESCKRECTRCGLVEEPPVRVGVDNRPIVCPSCGYRANDFPGSVGLMCGTCHRTFVEVAR